MSLCGNRSPISGECIIGCGGFGACRHGGERPLPPWPDGYNPLTGEFRPKLPKEEKESK